MSSAECVDVSSSRSGIRLRIEYFAEKPTAWRRFRRPNVSVGMVLWMETWHSPWRGRPDAKRFVTSAALVILSKDPSPPVWVCHVVPVPSLRTERLEYRTLLASAAAGRIFHEDPAHAAHFESQKGLRRPRRPEGRVNRARRPRARRAGRRQRRWQVDPAQDRGWRCPARRRQPSSAGLYR